MSHFDEFWAYRRAERITAHITIFMVCQVYVIKLHKINAK